MSLRGKSGTEGGLRAALLDWCRSRIGHYKGVNLTNLTTSWRDGLAFCALVHSIDASAIDYDSLKPENRLHNVRLAFAAAQKLGISPLLDAEDVAEIDVPEPLSMMTYISQYYHHVNGTGRNWNGSLRGSPAPAPAEPAKGRPGHHMVRGSVDISAMELKRIRAEEDARKAAAGAAAAHPPPATTSSAPAAPGAAPAATASNSKPELQRVGSARVNLGSLRGAKPKAHARVGSSVALITSTEVTTVTDAPASLPAAVTAPPSSTAAGPSDSDRARKEAEAREAQARKEAAERAEREADTAKRKRLEEEAKERKKVEDEAKRKKMEEEAKEQEKRKKQEDESKRKKAEEKKKLEAESARKREQEQSRTPVSPQTPARANEQQQPGKAAENGGSGQRPEKSAENVGLSSKEEEKRRREERWKRMLEEESTAATGPLTTSPRAAQEPEEVFAVKCLDDGAVYELDKQTGTTFKRVIAPPATPPPPPPATPPPHPPAKQLAQTVNSNSNCMVM